jgi:hypothetical protein
MLQMLKQLLTLQEETTHDSRNKVYVTFYWFIFVFQLRCINCIVLHDVNF